jgi:hypothetical protein
MHGDLNKDAYMTQQPGSSHIYFPEHICHLQKVWPQTIFAKGSLLFFI